MASNYALDGKTFKPVLVPNLSQRKYVTVLQHYLENNVFRAGIQGLQLGDSDRYKTLVAIMEENWSDAVAEIRDAAQRNAAQRNVAQRNAPDDPMLVEEVENDALFVGEDEDVGEHAGVSEGDEGSVYEDDSEADDDSEEDDYSEQEDDSMFGGGDEVVGGEEEANPLEAVGSMVRALVAERERNHAQEFFMMNAPEQCWVLAAAFAEALHEVQEKHAGPLRNALLGNAIQRVVLNPKVHKLEQDVDNGLQMNQQLRAKIRHLESQATITKSTLDECNAQLKLAKTELGQTKKSLVTYQQNSTKMTQELATATNKLGEAVREKDFWMRRSVDAKKVATYQQNSTKMVQDLATATKQHKQAVRESDFWMKRCVGTKKAAKEKSDELQKALDEKCRELEALQREAAEARKDMDTDYNQLTEKTIRCIGNVPKTLWDQVQPFYTDDMKTEGTELAPMME